jgi:hypothetical protein
MKVSNSEMEAMNEYLASIRQNLLTTLERERGIKDIISRNDPTNRDGLLRSSKAIEETLFGLNTLDRICGVLEAYEEVILKK